MGLLDSLDTNNTSGGDQIPWLPFWRLMMMIQFATLWLSCLRSSILGDPAATAEQALAYLSVQQHDVVVTEL